MQKSVPLPAPVVRTWDLRSLEPYALWTLLAAGLGELLLFRTMSRVGVHIPKQGAVLDVYDALVRLGSFAFDISSVTVFVALLLLAYPAARRWRDRPAPLAATPALILVLAALSLSFAFTNESPALKLTYGLLSLVIMLLLAAGVWTDGESDRPRRAIVGLIVLAYLASQYYTLANQAYRALGLSAAPRGATRALEAAELLVLITAFVIFWAWSGVREGRRWRPSPLQVGAAALLVVAFMGAYRGEDSSTAAILSLWTLGLTLYLPLPLYALGLGLYGATLVARLSRGRSEPAALGDAIALGLLLVAGLTLELTYQHLVAIVALLLLTAGRPETEDAEATAPAWRSVSQT